MADEGVHVSLPWCQAWTDKALPGRPKPHTLLPGLRWNPKVVIVDDYLLTAVWVRQYYDDRQTTVTLRLHSNFTFFPQTAEYDVINRVFIQKNVKSKYKL